MQTHDELVVKQKRKTSSDLKEAFFTQEKTHAILVTQCQLLAPQQCRLQQKIGELYHILHYHSKSYRTFLSDSGTGNLHIYLRTVAEANFERVSNFGQKIVFLCELLQTHLSLCRYKNCFSVVNTVCHIKFC